MNSFFSKLYIDLLFQLQTQVPELKWIEQDLGQDQTDVRPNVAFPAALIDFPRADYSDMGELGQMSTVSVQIRLMVSTYSQSYAAAPTSTREDALDYFELEHKVIEALHGWQPSGGYCQPLVRRSVSSQNRGDIGLRIRSITFDTDYESEF